MQLLSLRAGRLALDLAPQAGGSIARFTVDGIDLLRPPPAGGLAPGRGNESACYPLVPFSGRIAHGRLAFDGSEHVLKANAPSGESHPIHGDGWLHPWTVERSDGASAMIVYQHDGRDGWPFRYRTCQAYRLEGDVLTIGMSLENLEGRSVPGGLGLHPFFLRDAETELSCRTRYIWLTDAEVLPVERVAVPAKWDFARPRRVEGVTVDSCFEAWDGLATIAWPKAGLRLEMEASETFRDLVIYIPPGRRYFCVEPVSHVPGAIAATRLGAGETLSGTIAFRLSSQ